LKFKGEKMLYISVMLTGVWIILLLIYWRLGDLLANRKREKK